MERKSGSYKIRTKSLFHETNNSSAKSLYTTKDYDLEEYPSLYLLYLEANDPMERNFAKKYIPGGYKAWLKIAQTNLFREMIERWREELDVIVRSQALLEIRTIAEVNEGPTRYQANKFLLEGSWNPHKEPKDKTTKGKVGRPSSVDKQTIVSEADRLEEELINEHFKTLN